MREYCEGVVAQSAHDRLKTDSSVDSTHARRRKSVCVAPLFVLMQLGEAIDLPKAFFDDGKVKALHEGMTDLIILHNDLLSYQKEESEGVCHNVVAARRLEGMSPQEAVDSASTEIKRYHSLIENLVREIRIDRRWRVNQANVDAYIDGTHNVVRANLWWSLKSERFFNELDKERLPMIRVLSKPTYLDPASFLANEA